MSTETNWGGRDPAPQRISVEEWRELYSLVPQHLRAAYSYLTNTSQQTEYLNEPACFADDERDTRLFDLKYDNSLASLRLWSFLLSEEQRLHRARKAGKKLIGAMKDLGTVPVIAYSSDNAVAFYPDGAWWIPCLMEMSSGLLQLADSLGFGEEMCPARAAVAAFVKGTHFPMPDLCIGAVGACCDDFSTVMQRVSDLDIPFHWWELPYRSESLHDGDGPFVEIRANTRVPVRLVDFVERELQSVKSAIEQTLGETITDKMLERGIANANQLRATLAEIRDLAYGTIPCPYPSLEVQICEMIVLHFCSDRDEAIAVLGHVRDTVAARVKSGESAFAADACRVVWVNPVADLRIMNLVEDLGGVVAGSEYLFRHALEPIRTDIPPLRALALSALGDPMIGSARQRAQIIIDEAIKYNAEGVVISNIPGASHCASESREFRTEIARQLGLPVLEITVPPMTDSLIGQLSTRLEAFFEMIRMRRKPC